MKRRNLFLIGILISLLSFTTKAQETCVPDSIFAKMVDELIVKDGMEYELNKKDSTLTIYAHKDSLQRESIKIYKIKEGEWTGIVSKLEEREKIKDAEIKDLKHERVRKTIKTVLIDIVQTTVIVILTIVVIKSN